MATSCESRRTRAYDEDLRWRMIYQVKCLNKSYHEVGENLNVDSATVCRIVALFGSVTKKKYEENLGIRKLTESDKLVCLEIVIDNPGLYLREIAEKLAEETGTEVDPSTICRFLHKSGFTRQKMIISAKQRNELLRCEYMLDMTVFKGHPEFFIFIDETGTDKRDMMRKYAYSLQGKPAAASKIMVRGQRVSAIVGMSCNGILDFHTNTGTTSGDKFYDFVLDALVPHLQPFNGSNSHSVVVLDNASIHHVPHVVSTLQSTGALVQFLPPYSPDLNPIELAFAKTKSLLKLYEQEWQNCDTEISVITALNMITKEDCKSWISHCGYE